MPKKLIIDPSFGLSLMLLFAFQQATMDVTSSITDQGNLFYFSFFLWNQATQADFVCYL
jgi:hypothetical protein